LVFQWDSNLEHVSEFIGNLLVNVADGLKGYWQTIEKFVAGCKRAFGTF
jgi:hypothetical protein